MMAQGPDNDRRLDQYLDGQLSEAQRSEMERLLREDPALREAVNAQHAVDAALGRLFQAPVAPQDLLAALKQREASAKTSSSRTGLAGRHAWIGIAAAAAIAFAAWWNWALLFPTERTYPGERKPWRDVVSIYNEAIESGFKPEWVCKTDVEFQQAVASRLGQPLLLAHVPGITAVGWTYANTLTPKTMCLLTTVDTSQAGLEPKPAGAEAVVKIIVYIDRARAAKAPEPPADGRLQLFSRTIGKLVAYELTPLPRPVVLEHLYVP